MSIKPNFLIIGANKGGTTSLFQYLTEHPDVFKPEIKEPMFFNYYKEQQEDTNFRTQRVIRSISSYKELFEGSENFKAAGESSTSYLANPWVAEHIYDYNPEMKLIAILRNPIQRAYSNYLMYVRWGEEKRSFSKALKEELKGKELPQGKQYIALGYYYNSLKTYQEKFGKSQLKIFINEDLKDNPEETFKSICEYLKIATNFTPNTTKKYNTNNRVETRPVLKALKAVNRKLYITKYLPDNLKKRIATKPSMKKKDKELLLSLYADEIDNLQLFLNRDLSHWKK